jgi:hypothetical protein
MIPDSLLTAGGAVLALLAGVVAALWRARAKGRREGRETAQTEGLRDAAERMEKGRQAVQRGRDSGSTPADRLRRNDGDWR